VCYAFEKSDAKERWGGENVFAGAMGGRSLRHTAIVVYGNGAQDYMMADDVSAEQKVVNKAVRSCFAGNLSVLDEVGGQQAWSAFMQMLGADHNDDYSDNDSDDDGLWDTTDGEEPAAHEQSGRTLGWTDWREDGSGEADSGMRFTKRIKEFVLPDDDQFDDEAHYLRQRESSPIPVESLSDITYTVVGCGYTSRIPLSELPNAFWATDGLWGDDQQTADAAEHIQLLQRYFDDISLSGSFVFHGLANVDDLMSFGHCGCFNHANLVGAEIVEVMIQFASTFLGVEHTMQSAVEGDQRKHRVLFLSYDTESG